MSFEKIYEKYTLGTATEEEKKFVEEEIAKARKLSEIIDGKKTDGAILADADVATIKKARKRHSVKFALKALAISLAVAVTAVGAVVVSSSSGVVVVAWVVGCLDGVALG